MNIHLKGVFFLTQTLLPMIADGGRIVNLSSGLARFSLPGYAAYAAMKGGVEVLTRYLAKELGPRGIAVNTVAPARSRPTLRVAPCATTNKSTPLSPASQRSGARVCPTTSARPSRRSLARITAWINAQRIEVSGGMFV